MQIRYEKNVIKNDFLKNFMKCLILPLIFAFAVFSIFETKYRIIYMSITTLALLIYNIKEYIKHKKKAKRNIANLEMQINAIMTILRYAEAEILEELGSILNICDIERLKFLMPPIKIYNFLKNIDVLITKKNISYQLEESTYYININMLKSTAIDTSTFATELISQVVYKIILDKTKEKSQSDLRLQNNIRLIARAIMLDINSKVFRNKDEEVYLYVVK